MSLSLGGMEHNQSHSRESIKITHNRVKRSRLFLNAFMRTLRRANAISAPRKSATREFCKWRTEEHPRETKKNFERDDDEQRERERERREKQKRKGRRDAWCSFSLLLLLLTCGIFFREYARWSRAIEDVLCIYTVVVLVLLLSSSASSSFTWHARKSYDEEPFLVRVSIFSNSHRLYSPFHCAVLLREYRVRRTHNRLI